MGTEYIRAIVNGKEIHAQIVDGEVIGHDAWLITLCDITREELDKLIVWLQEIRSKLNDKTKTDTITEG